jgi:heat shock protein HslJ
MKNVLIFAVMLTALVLAACDSTNPLDPDTSQQPTQPGAAAPSGDYTLLSLNGQPALQGATITMQLGQNGASGSTGCNNYNALADTLTENEVNFGPIEVTEQDCSEPEGVIEQEAAFLDALRSVDTITQEGDTLTMTGEGVELIWTSGDATPQPTDDETTDDEDGMSFADAYSGQYELLTLNGTPVLEGTTITMSLDAGTDLTVSGSAGCNGYGGDIVSFMPDNIEFGPIASTMMACSEPEGIMEQETAFLQALENVDTLDEAQGSADIVLRGEGVELVWERDRGDAGRQSFAASLPGTQWQLTTLDGEEALYPATLNVTAEGMGGDTGCNQYFGTFTVEDGNAVSLSGIGATEIACEQPEGIMGFESRFLATFAEVAQVEPRGDESFAMLNAAGETVMVWGRAAQAEPASLEGTTWQLTTFVDGESASSTLAGTTVTLQLEEGRLSGNASCNTYNSSYTLEGDALTVAPEIATTRMACPDDIMSQEAAYLQVLSAVTGYQLEGTTLTLTTDDDRALVFEAS